MEDVSQEDRDHEFDSERHGSPPMVYDQISGLSDFGTFDKGEAGSSPAKVEAQ